MNMNTSVMVDILFIISMMVFVISLYIIIPISFLNKRVVLSQIQKKYKETTLNKIKN